MVRFKFKIPNSILVEGKHALLVDASSQYFGICAQKKSVFQNKVMVTSERTKQKLKLEKDMEEQKRKISAQCADEDAQYEYCKQIMQDYERNLLAKCQDQDQKSIYSHVTRVLHS